MNQRKYRVLGLMSGTSLDGLDLCLADFWFVDNAWAFSIQKAKTAHYYAPLRGKLTQAYTETGARLKTISHEYALYTVQQIHAFIEQNSANTIDFIASHGHTVYHNPAQKTTLQIGNGPEIFEQTGLPVVCDFRVQDVLLGGQGAPLVPIGDELLFGQYGACLNLGGFANISMNKNGNRIAFDICPVNIVLNAICQTINLPFDDQGKLAQQGTVNQQLLTQLNNLPFYKQNPPKSLGREWVEKWIDPLLKNHHPETALATVVEHVAQQVGMACKTIQSQILVTGGGAFNSFLIQRIQHHTQANLFIPSPELINFKEALIFGFLGVLRWIGQPNCLASVTGAETNHSSGKIYR